MVVVWIALIGVWIEFISVWIEFISVWSIPLLIHYHVIRFSYYQHNKSTQLQQTLHFASFPTTGLNSDSVAMAENSP